MKIAVDALRPNPFRHLERYPIDQEKVAALVRSIKDTKFWDNVLVRKSPIEKGAFELAYGHHRHVALDKLGIEEIDVPVRDLDDTTMAQIMAHENMSEWAHSAMVEQETVRAIIEAYGKGQIHLPTVKSGTKRGTIRIAPSFKVDGRDEDSPHGDSSYTIETLKLFLGWNEHKVESVLKALSAIEDDLVPEETFQGLTTRQGQVVVEQARRIQKEIGKPAVTKAMASALAAGMWQSTTGKKPRHQKGKHTYDVTIHNARSKADEMVAVHRPKNWKPMKKPDISRFIDKFSGYLIELFRPAAISKLDQLVESREYIGARDMKLLVGSLRTVIKRAQTYIDKLEG